MAEEKKPRLKLDRKLFQYVLPAVLIPTIVFLVATKGADLGQSEENAKRAAAELAEREKQLGARSLNPEQDAQNAAEEALLAARRAKQAEEERLHQELKNLPPEPKFDVDAASKQRQFDDLERTRQMLAGSLTNEDRQNVLGSQNPGKKSFLAYSAPKDEKLLSMAMDSTKDAMTIDNGKKKQGEKKSFFNTGNDKVTEFKDTTVAQRIESKYWLSSGTVLKGVLLNAIDTRIPGQVTARITEPVYDSRYGKYLVIPAGSSLIGQYSSDVAHGQNRVLMSFSSLITPSGGVVDLSGMRAADALGRTGMPGKLHTHFAQRMGIATLLALESIGMNRLEKSKTTVVSNGSSTTSDNQSEAAKIITEMAMRDPRLQPMSPNITVEEGQIISIVTTINLDIPPVANKR